MKSTTRLIAALIATVVLSGVAIGGVVLAQTGSPSASPTPKAAPTNPTAPAGQQAQPSTGGQTPSSGATARKTAADDFLNQLAQNLGISRSTLDNALKTTADQEVDNAVSGGKLTQAQATAIKQRIANGQFPIGFGGFGGFPGGPHGKSGARVDLRQALASALGISTSELQQDMKNGQTIAQIAQAQGKTTQDVQTAVVASVKSTLDAQVKAGTLTQSQEDSILQKIQTSVQNGNGILGGRGGHARGAKPMPTPGSGQ